MDRQPQSVAEYITAIRSQLVCDRCGRYVGSLADSRYLPPPYPIAVGTIGPDDEVAAQIRFEWHMAGKLGDGTFTIRHPQSRGRCVSVREWYDERAEDGTDDDDGEAEHEDD